MAADASRKVVVVRKKSEAQKVEVVAGPTPGELTTAPHGSGPTEKQRARRRRQSEIWREAHPGLRYVQFVSTSSFGINLLPAAALRTGQTSFSPA